jgi:hypothetical protein
MASDRQWAVAVRLLALISAVLLVIVVLEARTVRQARGELQQLRTERDSAKSTVTGTWARQSIDEAGDAVRWLNTFYAEPSEGLGRSGGLCAGGQLDDRAITSYVFGEFLQSRGASKSMEASIAAMRAAVGRSEAYRAAHPELAATPVNR